VLAFELGAMFAPNGEIFDEETVRRLMDIPELVGMKHSSLDRWWSWAAGVARCGAAGVPDLYGQRFGNKHDRVWLGLFAGAGDVCSGKFAERDRLWAAGDPAYYALSDALQYLGMWRFASRCRRTSIRRQCSCS